MSRKTPTTAYTATVDLILADAVEGLSETFRFAGPLVDQEQLADVLSKAGREARKPVEEDDGFR